MHNRLRFVLGTPELPSLAGQIRRGRRRRRCRPTPWCRASVYDKRPSQGEIQLITHALRPVRAAR